ncbi:hypothetical protein RRF57_004941 [Xylaria bambusicola]|uniref:Uncharacterized protein n=1 Tax=Xylaria bambusicola TaxID=326684 RepID=A0AAN7Z902_9PEZI
MPSTQGEVSLLLRTDRRDDIAAGKKEACTSPYGHGPSWSGGTSHRLSSLLLASALGMSIMGLTCFVESKGQEPIV